MSIQLFPVRRYRRRYLLLDLGFEPYKTPAWVLRRFASRLDPGFRKLQYQIKTTLDPDGLLNPGKWLT